MQKETAADNHHSMLWISTNNSPMDAIRDDGNARNDEQQAIQDHLVLPNWLSAVFKGEEAKSHTENTQTGLPCDSGEGLIGGDARKDE